MYFFRKYKDRMIVTGVAVILIIIIGVTSSNRMSLTKVEKTLGNLITPVSKIFFNVKKNTSEFFGRISNFSNILEENEELKALNTQLESENKELIDIIGKADYLKKELRLLESTKKTMLPANIASKEPGNWYDRFTIDKGLKDGVVKGATVVQGVEVDDDIVQEGIVGRVVDVWDNGAKVVSVIDELNKTAFKIIRTQDGGVISGSLNHKLSGYLFDNKSDVIVGDKLFTSGLGENFVKDIYIGEVESVIVDEIDLSKQIIIKPAINFQKLYKVFIILD